MSRTLQRRALALERDLQVWDLRKMGLTLPVDRCGAIIFTPSCFEVVIEPIAVIRAIANEALGLGLQL